MYFHIAILEFAVDKIFAFFHHIPIPATFLVLTECIVGSYETLNLSTDVNSITITMKRKPNGGSKKKFGGLTFKKKLFQKKVVGGPNVFLTIKKKEMRGPKKIVCVWGEPI